MSTEDDLKGAKTVLAVLGQKEIAQIEFDMGSIHIKPSMFQSVAQAIVDQKITVIIDPSPLKSTEAGLYVPVWTIDKDNEWYNLLFLRSATVAGSVNDQFHTVEAIVHECTHAGLDLLKVGHMMHYQHEAAAYVAQSVYAVSKMLSLKADPAKVPFTDGIEKKAWEIGRKIAEGKKVHRTEWNGLNVAIQNSDEYKTDAKKALKNQGVGRKWKINGVVEH